MEKKISETEHLATDNIQLLTGCAEVVESHRISLAADALILPVSPFFLAYQGRYFTPSIMEIGSVVRSLLAHFWHGGAAVYTQYWNGSFVAALVASQGWLCIVSWSPSSGWSTSWQKLPCQIWSEHCRSQGAKTPRHSVWGQAALLAFHSQPRPRPGGAQQPSWSGRKKILGNEKMKWNKENGFEIKRKMSEREEEKQWECYEIAE